MPVEPADVDLDVLIPTFQRPGALAVTLAGLAGQRDVRFRVLVSSQDEAADWPTEVKAVAGILRVQGRAVELRRHLPRLGLAEHRESLLAAAEAPYALFLDDDVWLEPDVVGRLLATIRRHGCGFVGAAPQGWSWVDDVKPEEQTIELWDGDVQPETIEPDSPGWERHRLHNGANLLHTEARLELPPGEAAAYRVAWIGGCVLYDVAALREAGGFGFWRDLPPEHAGEDVLAELRVMRLRGGCGVVPSGAWHLELPTTVPNRETDAPKVLAV
ncbi:MAG: glycosyltransferase family 2 protein [Chloroflexota bacterium]